MTAPDSPPADVSTPTPLVDLHAAEAARMTVFAGYRLPVHFPPGVIAEHQHTRAHASLFDVSHMGQAILAGPDAGAALERLVPSDISGLRQGHSRYTLFLDSDGNILDDLIVTRLSPTPDHAERFFLVVNASNKASDWAHLRGNLPNLRLGTLEDRALLALQGPHAIDAIWRRLPQAAGLAFMTATIVDSPDGPWFVSRSGYTGEDGFEISLPASEAVSFARALLDEPEVKPAGLGARDTLRLEAGLCLHGRDIDTTTNPVEAGLTWTIARRRAMAGGFPGSDRIRLQMDHGPSRRRVGLTLEGRQPARAGAEITTASGLPLGHVTSGGFAPTLGRAIAMGYVAADHATVGTNLLVHARGKPLKALVAPLPFVPHRNRAPIQRRASFDFPRN